MKNHFLSRFDSNNLRKTIIYFGISLPLIIISLVLGLDDLSLAAFMCPIGIAFFFYALLRPWGNAKYYGIMSIIFIILFFLLINWTKICLVLENVISVKLQLDKNLSKSIGEDFAFIGPIGVIVGIIGIFRFRKYD